MPSVTDILCFSGSMISIRIGRASPHLAPVDVEHFGEQRRKAPENCSVASAHGGRKSRHAYKLRVGTLVGAVNYASRPRISRSEAESTLMEGDVVEYPLAPEEMRIQSKRKGVGLVVQISSSTICHIEPLRKEDSGSNVWIHDEHQRELSVPLSQVQVLQAWYSQRMVPDRISNPHGEHAECLWIIESPSVDL